jgi:5-methylcytosine-specific restriction endonuclease McrA
MIEAVDMFINFIFILIVIIIWVIPKRKQSYNELLKTPEWKNKRDKILKRDNYTCRHCGKTDTILQVHHKYYHKYPNGTRPKPWDYPDEALITLCDNCHKRVHQTTKIKTYYRKKYLHYYN